MKRSLFFIPVILLFSCRGSEESSNEKTEEVQIEDTVISEVIEEPKIDIPHFGGDDAACFGAINDRFANWLRTDSIWQVFPGKNVVYAYLITHSDSIGPKEILDTDPDWGTIEWQQSFTNGMTFREKIHPEAGTTYNITTHCKDMQIIQKNIFPLIQNEDNVWNEESTSYSPTEGAGCYFDFKREADSTITIENYCGC